MMVESVKAKAERSIFSIKKGTILSDLIPRLKLPHEPLFAKIDEQIVERKSRQKMGTGPILLTFFLGYAKNGACPHFLAPFFLRYGDSIDL